METDDKDIVSAILDGVEMKDESAADKGGEGAGGQGASGDDQGDAGGNEGESGEPQFQPYKDEHGEYQFGKVFGQDFAEPTKIKETLTRAAKLPEIETELETLRTAKTQFEQQIADLSTKPTYKNPLYFKLDKISEETPSELPLYQSFALGSLTDMDLIKADLKTKYPDLTKEPDDLNIMLSNEYGALLEEEPDKDSTEYKSALMRLKMKAADLRGGIQSRLDKIEVPDAAKISAARQEETTQLISKWKEPFGKIAKDFEKISVTVPDEKDPKKEVELMKLDIPVSERNAYFQMASQHIATSRLSPDNGGAEQVSQLMKQMYIVNNFPAIVAEVADKASKSTGGKWRDLIHNTGRRTAAPGENQGSNADVSDQLMEKLKADNQF